LLRQRVERLPLSAAGERGELAELRDRAGVNTIVCSMVPAPSPPTLSTVVM
jgi:hypothetical protein